MAVSAILQRDRNGHPHNVESQSNRHKYHPLYRVVAKPPAVYAAPYPFRDNPILPNIDQFCKRLPRQACFLWGLRICLRLPGGARDYCCFRAVTDSPEVARRGRHLCASGGPISVRAEMGERRAQGVPPWVSPCLCPLAQAPLSARCGSDY